ncbi:MAG: hypothetical protein ACREF3_04135 [Acetobacteraceae bacterium]
MPGRRNGDRSAKQRIPATAAPALRQSRDDTHDRVGSSDAQRLERVLHDVNNLLTVIIGSLDDLCTLGPLDPLVCERINAALEAALRGTELAGGHLSMPAPRGLR